MYPVGEFIITLPVFGPSGTLRFLYLIIQTLRLDLVKQACYDQIVTTSDGHHANDGAPLWLAIASVVLVPVQVLILLLDLGLSNATSCWPPSVHFISPRTSFTIGVYRSLYELSP